MAAAKQTGLVKRLVEDQVLKLRWTPTWKQLADPLTKEMATDLKEFRQKGNLCLVETTEDRQEEARRSGLRKAQRERRKLRMKVTRKHLPSPM